MDIKNKLRKNVSLSYIYSFLLGLDITSAIWVLYLAFKGMSLVEIGALEGLGFLKSYSIIFFISISITGGVAYTIFSAYINERLPSEYRATILSFDGLCFSVFMIAVFPLFGILAHKLDFHLTFGILALLYIPIMLLLIIKIYEYSKDSLGGTNNDRISFK